MENYQISALQGKMVVQEHTNFAAVLVCSCTTILLFTVPAHEYYTSSLVRVIISRTSNIRIKFTRPTSLEF